MELVAPEPEAQIRMSPVKDLLQQCLLLKKVLFHINCNNKSLS